VSPFARSDFLQPVLARKIQTRHEYFERRLPARLPSSTLVRSNLHNMEQKTIRPQAFVGTVVKTAMKDTATVRVDRYVKNAKYKKYFVRSKKYLAHDPGNTVHVGDTVTIVATRPISKMKRFAIDPAKTIPAETTTD
jgi:small subunit ribosomal protein S17